MKKGFTLVELLGVITVLGLIAIIVFPNVTKSIKDSKNKLYQEQVSVIERNAKRWGIDHSEQLSEYSSTLVPLSSLITGGYLKKGDVIDPRNDAVMNGCVVIHYTNELSQYEYEYSDLDCSEIKFSTSEKCFIFDKESGTVTGYDDGCPKDVVIPEKIDGVNVTAIGDEAFMEKQITSVVIPNGVISIGTRSFLKNSLTKVDFPSSVVSIGQGAFGQNQLVSVTIPEGITKITATSFAKNQIRELYIPSTVTSIEMGAFAYNKLSSLEIPDGVTTIEMQAFIENELTTVVIPSSVMTIGSVAFYMNQLTSVTIQGKSSSADFTTYSDPFSGGWAEGYNDDNIIWNG